jgi:CheY-like chemotaxis protein
MKERKPDVVLLDLVLGDLDGYHVLKAKAEDDATRGIPVIAVSSTDPAGVPIFSDTLLVGRHDGFSAFEFLNCVKAISQVLTQSPRKPDPARQESDPGSPA